MIRARGRSLPEAATVASLRLLTLLVPTREHAVVAGAPDDEGNSVEVVRALSRRMRVYWLVNDDREALEWLVAEDGDPSNLRLLPKSSRRAFVAYLTARYVFFTHGLYGSPPPPRRKTVVNLWHGDGPKRRKGFVEIRSTYVVSGTELWGAPREQAFGVGHGGVLVTGNPRIDQFQRPATDAQLRTLGLDPARPVVLWLPTYRTTDYQGRRMGMVRNWSDGQELSGCDSVRSLFTQVRARAEELGVTVVVKPHPLDADRFAETGLRCLTNEQLREARVMLYQLLARTSGLITDYSSVWTDYLGLHRPVGFYCPDLAEYQENRGLNVGDYASLIPGPLLNTDDDFTSFLDSCLHESADERARRERCIDRIGAETRTGATSRLLRALGLTPAASRPRARV